MILTSAHTHTATPAMFSCSVILLTLHVAHFISCKKCECVCVYLHFVGVCVWEKEEVSSNPTKGKVVKTYSNCNETYDSLQWLQHNIPTCYETRISAVQKIPLFCICFEMVSLCIAVHTNISNRAKSGLVRAGNEENEAILTKNKNTWPRISRKTHKAFDKRNDNKHFFFDINIFQPYKICLSLSLLCLDIQTFQLHSIPHSMV